MPPAPPRRVYLFLAVGLVAASQSGNIIRIGDAPPLAIAAWRLTLASLLLAPLAGKQLARLAQLTRRELLFLLLSGVALATHFYAWITAVQLTTVANAATFFAINPVITASFGYLVFRERVSKRLLLSIALGITGVVIIGWGDLSFAPEHLAGDLWALVCSALFTAYFLLGKRLRQKLPTSVYVTAVYGLAAVVSLAALPAFDAPYFDYDRRTWLCFVLMALIPTMIGHTSLNNALAHLRAGWISTATLS